MFIGLGGGPHTENIGYRFLYEFLVESYTEITDTALQLINRDILPLLYEFGTFSLIVVRLIIYQVITYF